MKWYWWLLIAIAVILIIWGISVQIKKTRSAALAASTSFNPFNIIPINATT